MGCCERACCDRSGSDPPPTLQEAISRCLLSRACADGADGGAACGAGAATAAAELVPFLKAFEVGAPGLAGPAPRLRGLGQAGQPAEQARALEACPAAPSRFIPLSCTRMLRFGFPHLR